MSSQTIGLTTRKKPACRIREASFHDYEEVCRLQSRYGLETKSYEDWRHLWLNNPAYLELQREWKAGWILENEEGKTVGYLGNIPLFYLFRGVRLRVSTSYAWVVDEAYRSYSLWLLDEYFAQKNVDLYLNTSVSPEALAAYTQYNSLKVPAGTWDQSIFAITDVRGFAESALRMRSVRFPAVLGIPLSAVLYCREVFSRPVAVKSASLELCRHFDDRFDSFWQELRNARFGQLLGMRTREILEWHFGPALARSRVWILAYLQGSRLVAYAIFLRHDKPKLQLKRMQLVDFQSLDGKNDLLPLMLAWAIERCRQERIHMLEYVGFRSETREYTGVLSHKRTLPSWLYFYKATKAGLAEQLRAPDAWTPYVFDGDLSL